MCVQFTWFVGFVAGGSRAKISKYIIHFHSLHYFVRAFSLFLLYSFVVAVVVVVVRGNDLIKECPKAMSDRLELHKNETVF